MPAIAIYYELKDELNDLSAVINTLSGWDFYYFDPPQLTTEEIFEQVTESELHFVLCTRSLTPELKLNLKNINTEIPLLTTIYFSRELKDQEFTDLYSSGINFCIVGKDRKENLKSVMEKLLHSYWKNIPGTLYNTAYQTLSPRAKRILRYIENRPFKYCNTKDISLYLKISQSHFRKEFKSHFGINFRSFKQNLLHYYEDELLFRKKLKPGQIYTLFDYTNLSAFSRSFRSRHGHSWQKLIRLKH